MYRLIEKVFIGNGSVNSAAEAYGLAVGMLCVNHDTHSMAWLKQVFEEDALPSSEQARQLVSLFDEAKAALAGDDYDFEPLLPDDETSLSERVAAFSDWCQGFLYGIGALAQAVKPSAEAQEILRDIAEFTKLDTAAAGEEDETAFMEICEYLRTAVLLLYAELGSNERPMIH